MKLFTLIAGYAAGLAVAMKYRKNAGTSKLETDASKSKMDAFIDEVVDIHKSAYTEIRKTVSDEFEGVDDLDSLKAKLMSMVDAAKPEIDAQIAKLKETGVTKKSEITASVEAFLAEKQGLIDQAKQKALSFAGVSEAEVDKMLADAKAAFAKISSTEKAATDPSVTPEKKPAAKKPAAKKVTEKAPAKKSKTSA